MRLKYLYASVSSAIHPIPYDASAPTQFELAHQFTTEGFYWLFRRLLETGVLEDVEVFIESARSPGLLTLADNFRIRVIPHIQQIDEYLKPADIIFVRGGFKTWFVKLEQLQAEGHWILFYQAATQRGNWLFWDVVFNDLIRETFVDPHRRLQLAFKKPTRPDLFFPRDVPREYDLCIGASHIHDKKAQYKVVNAVKAYYTKYGKWLRCILPGRTYHGLNTNVMFEEKERGRLPSIDFPGMVPRREVNNILNRSKLFVHVGTAGQNDRGVLESMAAGTPVMLQNLRYHAPFTFENQEVSFVITTMDDPARFARDIHTALQLISENLRKKVREYYVDQCDVETVILPQFTDLFNFLKYYPTANREELWRHYGLLQVSE